MQVRHLPGASRRQFVRVYAHGGKRAFNACDVLCTLVTMRTTHRGKVQLATALQTLHVAIHICNAPRVIAPWGGMHCSLHQSYCSNTMQANHLGCLGHSAMRPWAPGFGLHAMSTRSPRLQHMTHITAAARDVSQLLVPCQTCWRIPWRQRQQMLLLLYPTPTQQPLLQSNETSGMKRPNRHNMATQHHHVPIASTPESAPQYLESCLLSSAAAAVAQPQQTPLCCPARVGGHCHGACSDL